MVAVVLDLLGATAVVGEVGPPADDSDSFMVRNNHEMPRCLLVQTNREVGVSITRQICCGHLHAGGHVQDRWGWECFGRCPGWGAQLTQPGHSEIAGMDFSKGSDPDDD